MSTGVMRAGAGWDTWRRLRGRTAQRPYVYAVLLAFLAVSESLAEFGAGHGSVPRLFADAGSSTGRVQLTPVLGLFCLATALPPLFLRPLTAAAEADGPVRQGCRAHRRGARGRDGLGARLAAGRATGRGFTPEHGYPALSLTGGPTLRAAVGSVLYLVLAGLPSLGPALVARDSATATGIVPALLSVGP
ncbi:hypothetical protein [Streptomyces sp. NPDC001980]|uniref:hypothetical protein n=1 Tax=Streptomyces sp. NPDC001980 TaxID=3157126 RepID=UPI00332C304B